jgi:hypothetical protein
MAAIIAVVLFGSLLVAFILAGFDGWEHLARERRNRRETQADQIRELAALVMELRDDKWNLYHDLTREQSAREDAETAMIELWKRTP